MFAVAFMSAVCSRGERGLPTGREAALLVKRCFPKVQLLRSAGHIVQLCFWCCPGFAHETLLQQNQHQAEVAMSKAVTAGATALLGCILCATPVTLRLSPEGKVSLSMESASAVDAGVNRRAHRRAYRRDPNDYWACGQVRCDYSAYERFSYHGFWGNYGFAHTPGWSR